MTVRPVPGGCTVWGCLWYSFTLLFLLFCAPCPWWLYCMGVSMVFLYLIVSTVLCALSLVVVLYGGVYGIPLPYCFYCFVRPVPGGCTVWGCLWYSFTLLFLLFCAPCPWWLYCMGVSMVFLYLIVSTVLCALSLVVVLYGGVYGIPLPYCFYCFVRPVPLLVVVLYGGVYGIPLPYCFYCFVRPVPGGCTVSGCLWYSFTLLFLLFCAPCPWWLHCMGVSMVFLYLIVSTVLCALSLVVVLYGGVYGIPLPYCFYCFVRPVPGGCTVWGCLWYSFTLLFLLFCAPCPTPGGCTVWGCLWYSFTLLFLLFCAPCPWWLYCIGVSMVFLYLIVSTVLCALSLVVALYGGIYGIPLPYCFYCFVRPVPLLVVVLYGGVYGIPLPYCFYCFVRPVPGGCTVWGCLWYSFTLLFLLFCAPCPWWLYCMGVSMVFLYLIVSTVLCALSHSWWLYCMGVSMVFLYLIVSTVLCALSLVVVLYRGVYGIPLPYCFYCFVRPVPGGCTVWGYLWYSFTLLFLLFCAPCPTPGGCTVWGCLWYSFTLLFLLFCAPCPWWLYCMGVSMVFLYLIVSTVLCALSLVVALYGGVYGIPLPYCFYCFVRPVPLLVVVLYGGVYGIPLPYCFYCFVRPVPLLVVVLYGGVYGIPLPYCFYWFVRPVPLLVVVLYGGVYGIPLPYCFYCFVRPVPGGCTVWGCLWYSFTLLFLLFCVYPTRRLIEYNVHLQTSALFCAISRCCFQADFNYAF